LKDEDEDLEKMATLVHLERAYEKFDQFSRLSHKQDESFCLGYQIYSSNWTATANGDAEFCTEKMFFKKEQVEQAKRMKIKLRTESSFERPETNSGMGHFNSFKMIFFEIINLKMSIQKLLQNEQKA
jgi:hypothetical protein